MSESVEYGETRAGGGPEEVPFGQRLYDRPFFWLIAGIAVMAIVYTGWGLVEILTLPQAPLP